MGTHPKGLYLLAATEMAERFSYYGMRALFVLYMVAAFFTTDLASQIYGVYTGLVYLTPLIGGIVADRLWGHNRSIIVGGILIALGQFCMFLSASFAKQSIFTAGAAVSASVDNTMPIFLLICALVLIILGNGFFKPNISTMVGSLYDADDARRDSAFTIFYMGINFGAVFAPIICGIVGQGSWDNIAPFKWGFLCACIAMVVSLVLFVLLRKRYLVTPGGEPIGLPPTDEQKRAFKEANAAAASNRKASGTHSKGRIALLLLASIALYVLFIWNANDVTDYISSLVFDLSIVVAVYVATDPSLTLGARRRLYAIYIFAGLSMFFFAVFEQAGASLTLIADTYVDRSVGGFTVPTAWFQSVEPCMVVIMAPIMATLWERLDKRGKNPSVPAKFVIGMFLLTVAYLVFALASGGIGSGSAKISMLWLVALYLIESIGELTISPIGLSLVNSLAPRRSLTLVMGVWFSANAIGNLIAGNISTLLPTMGPDGSFQVETFLFFQIASIRDFSILLAVVSACTMLLAIVLVRPLLRLMRSDDELKETA